MMLIAGAACLVLVADTIATDSEAFEPQDLNIINALIEIGADVSTIPALAVKLPSPEVSLPNGL
jgi:hypothetical protein